MTKVKLSVDYEHINKGFGLRNNTVNGPSNLNSKHNPLVRFEEWNELVRHHLIPHKQKVQGWCLPTNTNSYGTVL